LIYTFVYRREQFPDGILYTSQESHYSIFKIARMYRMHCVKVGSLFSGEIDCVQLEASLLAHKDKPAIINLNIGISYLLIKFVFGNNIFTCTKQVEMMVTLL
jgi:hypothetical protein